MSRLEPKFVSVKEAAEFLGIERWRLYELLNGGVIEGRYDGTKRLVSVASMHEWGDSLPTDRPVKESA